MQGQRKQRGFTLVELIMALVIAALLMSLAIPMYNDHARRAKVAKAIGDISSLQIQIERFRLNNRDRVPDNLAELGVPIPEDPWGRAYVFLNILDGSTTVGDVRKDGALNPLNTDYDLYSVGEDGETQKPLNAAKARDDIVRANNGDFIGLAEDY